MRITPGRRDHERIRARRRSLWHELAWTFGSSFAITLGLLGAGYWLGHRERCR